MFFFILTPIFARKLIVTNALNREKERIHLRWTEYQNYQPESQKTSCYLLHPPFRQHHDLIALSACIRQVPLATSALLSTFWLMLVFRVCLFSASSSVSTNIRFVASLLFVRLSSGVSKRVLTFPCQRELEMEHTNMKDL